MNTPGMLRARRVMAILASLALLGLLVLAGTASASTSPWGELARFAGKETTGAKKGNRFLFSAATHLFGVDQHENGIFVGDDFNENSNGGKFRIQKYSESGTWLGQVAIEPPKEAGTEEAFPPSAEGVAVDAEAGVIYVLVVYQRSSGAKIDPSMLAAGGLYAFKAEPEKEVLVPAPGTKSKGLLASLEPASETAGKALLEPRGLTVNAKTHEVLILGVSDKAAKEANEDRQAILRVGKEGKVEGEYESSEVLAQEEPAEPGSSPVWAPSGNVYFERNNQILYTSMKSESAPKPVLTLGLGTEGPLHQELVTFAEGAEATGEAGEPQLALAEAEGGLRLFSASQTAGSETNGPINTALMLRLEDSATPKVSELGWTGGIFSEEAIQCAIETGGQQNTLVGAGKEGDLFAVTSRPGKGEDSEGEVVKFGPGGTGCPTAKSAGPVEAFLAGTKVSELDTTHTFTLSAAIAGENAATPGASVLSTEWTIGGEKLPTVTTPTGTQVQAAQIEHKFTSGGEVKVEATIHTDDLATPELKVATTLHVKTTVEIKGPTAQEVVEGETAKFSVETVGGAKPPLQWEVSEDGGSTWKEIAGKTGETLEIANAKVAETGHLYRVTATVGANKQESKEAKLTVLAPAPPNITRQPANTEVEEGSSASFTATATGEPAPSVQWELSTDGGRTYTKILGATTGTLTVASTTTAQTGNDYRAVFTNTNPVSKEVKSATSNPATLRVRQKVSTGGGGGNGGIGNGGGSGGGTGQGGVESFREGSPTATLALTSTSVTPSGTVALKVSCPTGTFCTGTVTLKTLTAVAARAHPSKKAKKTILTLAQVSFSVAGGTVQTVKLQLSGKARKLLQRMKTVRARATIFARNKEGASVTTQAVVTLKLAAKKKKHKHR